MSPLHQRSERKAHGHELFCLSLRERQNGKESDVYVLFTKERGED